MVKLFSKNSNLCDHNSPTSKTDRRTDRQTTCDRNTALCTKVHLAVKTSTQLSRCCWVRKINLRANRNFTWGGGSIDHLFRRLFTKFCMHALFSVCSLRDNNAITSKPTWKPKHVNSILEPSEYFYQISSKSIHTILSYTVAKLGRFLRHSVVFAP